MLAKPPDEQIEYLLTFAPETPFGSSREDLLEAVSDATMRKYQWGRELAVELEVRELWNKDLWSPLIRGWTRADLKDDQWMEVLTFLDGREKLHPPFVREIASLIDEGIKRPSQPIPDAFLLLAVDLSKKLWAVLCREGGGPPKKQKDPDWGQLAFSHAAGMTVLFWLNWLVRERKRASDGWQGIPNDIRIVLDPIVTEPAYAGRLGCVLLASQLNLLYSADEIWTKEHVLPLFDWSRDDTRAVQAFQGFLMWGRQTENLLIYLLPLYERAFAHLPELGRHRERFAIYLAGLAFAASINPVTHGWLNRFVAAAPPEDRIRWAFEVRRILRGSADAGRSVAWSSWIRSYWGQRILGVPLPLDPLEVGEMVEWTLQLGPSFPEVVDSVMASPKFELRHSSLLRDLAASALPQQHPVATASLLLKVLQNAVPQFQYDLDKVEDSVRRIAPLHAPAGTLNEICNELAKLGYPPAAELQVWLQGGHF